MTTSKGLDDLFRGLQRAEIDIAARDQALRLAWEFWRVVREISSHGPNRELLRKLDETERAFLNAVDVLGWSNGKEPVGVGSTVERIEA